MISCKAKKRQQKARYQANAGMNVPVEKQEFQLLLPIAEAEAANEKSGSTVASAL